MKLKRLLKDIPIREVRGSKDINITGVTANSKLVAPGNLFIARKGASVDGAQFIPEAIAAGAVAVLTDMYDPFLKVTQLLDSDIAGLESLLAATYYENASRELFVVGVTGTNGKTTTSYLVKHLLDKLEMPSGLIGTIECLVGSHRYQASRTTPDVATNHKMLREMVNEGCKAVSMEVTSHALDQGRVDYIEFKAAIFTNLTGDHLDYHKTMDEYARAKSLLFERLSPDSFAIVNSDDPYAKKIGKTTAQLITYGIEEPADLMALGIKFSASGTRFEMKKGQEVVSCFSPFVGRFNVYNYLAAASLGVALGVSLSKIASILEEAPPVPGRLEYVPNSLGLKVYVDYAHSDDSLEKVLRTLRELHPSRIITVFGCGGDRDKTKRPRMGRVAEEFSDLTIITSDNPRSEDPKKICEEIVAGFRKKDYLVEIDRRAAIGLALERANPEDIILIAGKGHETYQIFSGQTIDFDDRLVVQEICGVLR